MDQEYGFPRTYSRKDRAQGQNQCSPELRRYAPDCQDSLLSLMRSSSRRISRPRGEDKVQGRALPFPPHRKHHSGQWRNVIYYFIKEASIIEIQCIKAPCDPIETFNLTPYFIGCVIINCICGVLAIISIIKLIKNK